MRKDTEYEKELGAFLDEDPEKAKRTRDIAFFVIVLSGMLISYIVSQNSKAVMAAVLGVMFLLVGIVFGLYNRKIKAYPEQWLRPAGAVLVGLAMIVLPIFGKFGDPSGEFTVYTIIMFALFAFMIGGLLIAAPIFEASMKKRRCTNVVMASCVGLEHKGKYFYEHIWEYPYGSIKVTASDKIMVSGEKPYVGSIEQIAVNPDDPNDIYRRVPSRTVFMILTGSLVMFIGAVLFVILGMMLAH